LFSVVAPCHSSIILAIANPSSCFPVPSSAAPQQASAFADIGRALKTVAAMQKLDYFKNQFGPDVVSRKVKPLAAAKEALEQARVRAAK
jgi:hypothetical protein